MDNFDFDFVAFEEALQKESSEVPPQTEGTNWIFHISSLPLTVIAEEKALIAEWNAGNYLTDGLVHK